MSIFEKGDNLEVKAIKLRNWFKENNVLVPKTAREWQNRRAKEGNIPPGCTYATFQKAGISVAQLINLITGEQTTQINKQDPITIFNIEERLGLVWLEDYLSQSKHKKVETQCIQCDNIEVLDYGTLKRMYDSGNKHCRNCRDAGGKPKDISKYDIFEGFIAVHNTGQSSILYECTKCHNTISRTFSTISAAEYIVCENCNPGSKTNIVDPVYGSFDSKMELESYKILLKYLDLNDVQRQVSYNTLFKTNTKHTADFYIPKLNLCLEVTTKNNNLARDKYTKTMDWKKSFGVIFAFTLKEVDDIVRSAMKVVE